MYLRRYCICGKYLLLLIFGRKGLELRIKGFRLIVVHFIVRMVLYIEHLRRSSLILLLMVVKLGVWSELIVVGISTMGHHFLLVIIMEAILVPKNIWLQVLRLTIHHLLV